MAKLYGEIDAKALLTLDKSFARANGQPLDASEVYYSKAAAETYAQTAQAYIGQKIVVIENGIVTHYSVETTDGTLKELGSKPVADGTTVAIDEATGKITLANIAESNQTGTYNAVLVNGVLTWVKPSETTVEGLSDLIAALTTRVTTAETDIDALQAAVGVAAKDAEGTEGDADYKPAVAATGLHKAIADEITRATAAEQALSTKIGTASKPESAEGAGDGVVATGIIADIENLQNTKANISYVDSAIKADLTTLVGDDKDSSGKATKSIRTIANEEAINEVTKLVNGAPEALDTLKEIADWIIDDNTGSAAVVEDIAKHDAILDGLGGTDEPATVVDFVAQQIAAIPLATLVTGENTVTATKGLILPEQSMFEMTDGKVTAVSTDLLTQGNNTLILNGGSANT